MAEPGGNETGQSGEGFKAPNSTDFSEFDRRVKEREDTKDVAAKYIDELDATATAIKIGGDPKNDSPSDKGVWFAAGVTFENSMTVDQLREQGYTTLAHELDLANESSDEAHPLTGFRIINNPTVNLLAIDYYAGDHSPTTSDRLNPHLRIYATRPHKSGDRDTSTYLYQENFNGQGQKPGTAERHLALAQDTRKLAEASLASKSATPRYSALH